MEDVAFTDSESQWIADRKNKIDEVWGTNSSVVLRRTVDPSDHAALTLHVLSVKLPGWDSSPVSFETDSAGALAVSELRRTLFEELAAELGEAPESVSWQ